MQIKFATMTGTRVEIIKLPLPLPFLDREYNANFRLFKIEREHLFGL
jgi:hypothetical protein